jgi:alpha,alpha-trehalose phosphorylase
VHPMNDNFTAYREWRFDDHRDAYPLQEHHHYAKIYRRQVLKQADLVQALWWCRDDFTDEEMARDLDYYEARTVRDSSLSAAVQAVVCAQAGHPDLALRYLREAAMVDLRDVQGDTDDGLHLAAVAGAWLALAAGLGGLREDHEHLELAPVLPAALERTAYRVTWRGQLLRIETTREGTTVSVLRGDRPVTVVVDGSPVQVTTAEPARLPLRAPTPLLGEPTQPVGRAPST